MAKRDALVVVASGPGWALAWPRERWDVLTAAQQQDVIDSQVALLSQSVPLHRTLTGVQSHRRGRTAKASGSPAGVLA